MGEKGVVGREITPLRGEDLRLKETAASLLTLQVESEGGEGEGSREPRGVRSLEFGGEKPCQFFP